MIVLWLIKVRTVRLAGFCLSIIYGRRNILGTFYALPLEAGSPSLFLACALPALILRSVILNEAPARSSSTEDKHKKSCLLFNI
jgi:hypothetical protein